MIKVDNYYVTIIAPNTCLVSDTVGKWFTVQINNGIVNINGQLYQLIDKGMIKL